MPPRAKKPPPKVRPVVRIEGQVLTMEDFTLAEYSRIESATGAPWYEIRPMAFARHGSAVLVEALCRAGVDRAEAHQRVDAMTARQFTEHITLEEFVNDDDRPAEYQNGVPVVDPKADPDVPATTG